MPDKIEMIKELIEAQISNSLERTDLKHAELTLKWALRLNPQGNVPFQLAAFGHDYERSFPERLQFKDFNGDYELYKNTHAKKSAEMIALLMEEHDFSPEEINETAELIKGHETGVGSREIQYIADADSLAFFEWNLRGYLEKSGENALKMEIAFMYKRLSYKAKIYFLSIKTDDDTMNELVRAVVRETKEKSPLSDKKCLIIMPHFDDEYLMACSFLANFHGGIHVIFTHQGDSLNRERYESELDEMVKFSDAIHDYRKRAQLGTYAIEYLPCYGDVNRLGVTENTHKTICDAAEKLINRAGTGEWDYCIYPSESIHQNHRQCNGIAASFLRVPYLYKFKAVLMGNYPPEIMVNMQDTIKDCVYRTMSIEEMDRMAAISHDYIKKLEHFPVDQTKVIFQYYGMRVNDIWAGNNWKYAQSFFPKHIRMD